VIDLGYFIERILKILINSKDVKKLRFQLDLSLTYFIFRGKKSA
jgi:hypothetical protein